MTTALWIIAICEIVRMLQNFVPVIFQITERKARYELNNKFIDSLKKDNREWVEDTLNDFVKHDEVRVEAAK